MSTHTPKPSSVFGGPGDPTPNPTVIRVPERLRVQAATRLVSQASPDRVAAARRLVAAAPAHGIDLSLIWAVTDRRNTDSIRQLCLAVPSPGRTAMLFVSEPPLTGDSGGEQVATRERAQCIMAACRFFEAERATRREPRVVLVQGLPEPREHWSTAAFEQAGFRKVGDLCYMRLALAGGPSSDERRGYELPDGIVITPLSAIEGRQAQDNALIEALDATYADTLDCPDLCGLRETRDVLESHRATGTWSSSLWWIVFDHSRPCGCLLLNRCPDLRSVELVYLGLSPSLRGKGVAAHLLGMGAAAASQEREIDAITCAVDLRNQPALALYQRAGFRAVGERLAFVHPV